MIFLGFLGAEVLARRYVKCVSSNSKENIDRFIWSHKKSGSIQLFIIKNYIKEIFKKPICFILHMIILLTIASAITLVINWLDLMAYLDWLRFIGFLSGDELKTINSEDLWAHFLWTLLIVFTLMVMFNLLKSLSDYKVNKMDVANELQTIALENDFELLQECIDTLIDNNIDVDDILKYCINSEAKDIILQLTKLCQDKNYLV